MFRILSSARLQSRNHEGSTYALVGRWRANLAHHDSVLVGALSLACRCGLAVLRRLSLRAAAAAANTIAANTVAITTFALQYYARRPARVGARHGTRGGRGPRHERRARTEAPSSSEAGRGRCARHVRAGPHCVFFVHVGCRRGKAKGGGGREGGMAGRHGDANATWIVAAPCEIVLPPGKTRARSAGAAMAGAPPPRAAA